MKSPSDLIDPFRPLRLLWRSWSSANERQIARRYLYRFRRSKAVIVVTVLFGLLSTLAVSYYFARGGHGSGGFGGHENPVTGALAILLPLVFLAIALLNLFSVFSTVAVVGVMLGVAALTVVLAVTSGFQSEIRNRVIGVNAHILILKYGIDFRESDEIMKKVAGAPQVVAVSPFVFNEMLIAREGGASAGVLVKGIDVVLSPKVLDLEQRLQPLPDGTRTQVSALKLDQAPIDGGPPLPGAFVGKELARKMKVKVGDRVRLIAPLLGMDGSIADLGGDNGKGDEPQGNPLPPRSLEFRLAGIFVAGFDEYDRRLVYVDLARAQDLAGQGDVVTGVEVRVRDADKARKVAAELETVLGGAPYRTLDWEELNHNLFTALAVQKTALGLVLFLIVLVAAFNIVASLTMMVIDKSREVAILKAMGMSSRSVAAVFRTAGMTIGLCGTAMGIFMGLLVCAVLTRLGFLLDAKVYLIDHLPIRVSPWEVVVVAAATLFICFLATLYPSLRAAGLPPVDGLRYE